jgi:hypothetical protein
MAKLVASTFVGKGELWLYLDEKLIMRNNDTVELELEEGQEYVVYWFVKGVPGGSYSVTISSPREAQYQLTRGLGRGGRAGEVARFIA